MQPSERPAHGPLAASAMQSLLAAFAALEVPHMPGEAHRKALEAVMATMEAMAEGRAAQKVYLSSLDPGVGKSSAIVHFGRTLVKTVGYGHVGMLILVGRIKEADDIAKALGDAVRPYLAVRTSDADLNCKWSGATPEQAQILITTHQRVERDVQGRSFASLSALHFRGVPRAVRVHDEAWLPGVAISLRRDDLLTLVAPMRRPFPEIANTIEAFGWENKDLAHNATVTFPDFEGLARMSAYAVIDTPGARFNDEECTVIRDMFAASGSTVRAFNDKLYGITFVTYSETWPEDFAPMLVLDASGRVRHAYRFMQQYRNNLVMLPSAAKDYAPLKVRLWSSRGGKSAFRDDKQRDHCLKGIAELIASRPDERWLVVSHLHGRRQDATHKALQKLLPSHIRVSESDPSAAVQTITWGMHMATNAYRDVPNVILAGTLFMKESHDTALTHLAQGIGVEDGFRPRGDVFSISQGEKAHNILQALCRGRVRQLQGDQCKAMNAYIIAADRSGIADLLPDIFPGCDLGVWRKDDKTTGKAAEAVAFLDQQTKAGALKVTYRAVQEAIGVSSKNFAKLVTANETWTAAMKRLGWRTDGGQRVRGLVRA